MSNPQDWIQMPVTEQMVWDAVSHDANIRDNNGFDLFRSGNEWQGFCVELAVKQWLTTQGMPFKYDDPTTRADKYDFMLGNQKIDVKASHLINCRQYIKKKWINVYLFGLVSDNQVLLQGWLYRHEVNLRRIKRRNMASPAYIIGVEDLHPMNQIRELLEA
jgi:hypothetical protein